MHTYQKFSIKDTDVFQGTDFPQLNASLQQVVTLLAREPHAPKAEMILSFVKHHCIASEQVSSHPKLAHLISSKTLSLQVIEDLFDASKTNPSFRKGLENYIVDYLRTAHVN